MLFFFVDIVVVLLFCRNSTFELVVDHMRAGQKKMGGSRGSAPPPRGGMGGAESPSKKRLWSINSSNNHNGTIEISRTKIKQT